MFRDPRVQASWWETVRYMRDEDNPFYARFEAKLKRAKRKAQAAHERAQAAHEKKQAAHDRYVDSIMNVLGRKNIQLTSRELQQLHEMETLPDVEVVFSANSHDEFVAKAGLETAAPQDYQSGKD